jgi:hypothetical protein
MTRGQGFGKPSQALPVKAKGKLQNYTMEHLGSDGVVRSVRLKARSKTEALDKFQVFVQVLELCLSDADDKQILHFMQENSL